MNNPLVHAFFVGRAVAEAIGEQIENAVTGAMGELGKFDAEQRERLRQFTAQVLERASLEESLAMQGRTSSGEAAGVGSGFGMSSGASGIATDSEDLQAVIDDLRAETAQLRTELQRYRNRSV